MRSDATRIAVTGIGLRTPAGNDLDALWSALMSARSCATTIDELRNAGLSSDFGCPVRELDNERHFTAKEADRADRGTKLGYSAAADAIEDAGPFVADPERRGVVFGSSVGGLSIVESVMLAAENTDVADPKPSYIPAIMPNATAALVGMKQQFHGPTFAVATMCATGAHAIGEAARVIREGAADVMVAGAVDALLTPTIVLAFQRAGALSGRSSDPGRASSPFDVDRDGFVIAEGAGALVLERFDLARARGARIHAELIGYGRAADGYHVTAPHPEGRGAISAMRAALRDGGLDPGDIANVNAHGTSTPRGDAVEAAAIRAVFGSHRPPVTSTKGVTGHTLAAAGSIESAVAIRTLQEGKIHPTANHHRTDPQCDIDVVTVPTTLPAGAVMSNSFGFGGASATLVYASAAD